MIGQKLAEAWVQPGMVDIRSEANGDIRTDLVAKAEPNGYMLLLTDIGNLSISPTPFRKLPFSPTRNLMPVTMLA